MQSSPENLTLADSTFMLLRDLIHEHIGVSYESDKRELLADKLLPRVIERGFSSYLDYYYLLKYDDTADTEWKYLIDALSVQETFFWREFDQINALVEAIAPQHLANSPYKPLRIWSAACATGEEPLTIAMALNEAGWFQKMAIEIYASDASHSAIAKAEEGLYRDRAFRSLSPALKAKYFQDEAGLARISPEIHNRIKWSCANLVSKTDLQSFPPMSVIFCRNVFIYFSEPAIRKTLELFVPKLLTPGYLFVGASESLLKLTNALELQEIAGAFVYVKN
ncbi:MAG TPA: protein-glutamate O-methyltransferase CheR [Oculatellaceae cyanobacterium]|jgi:chemotaxis protein methyltransferase CheR